MTTGPTVSEAMEAYCLCGITTTLRGGVITIATEDILEKIQIYRRLNIYGRN